MNNRRQFFSQIGAILGAVSASPLIFIPKFEPIVWKPLRIQRAAYYWFETSNGVIIAYPEGNKLNLDLEYGGTKAALDPACRLGFDYRPVDQHGHLI